MVRKTQGNHLLCCMLLHPRSRWLSDVQEHFACWDLTIQKVSDAKPQPNCNSSNSDNTVNSCFVSKWLCFDLFGAELESTPLKYWTSEVRAAPRSSGLTCSIPATANTHRYTSLSTEISTSCKQGEMKNMLLLRVRACVVTTVRCGEKSNTGVPVLRPESPIWPAVLPATEQCTASTLT